METISIIGAGLTGSLLGIYLAKLKFPLEIFEKRPDLRKLGNHPTAMGKSINLALSSRGILALEQVGLMDKIRPKCVKMLGRMVHDIKGDINYIPYGRNDLEFLYSISRKELNSILLDELEKYSNTKVYFEHELDSLSPKLTFKNGKTFPYTKVLGADGSSGILRNLFPTIRYKREDLEHSYLELSMPPNHGFDLNYLHIWPRDEYMLIGLPNPQGDFTCTLFISQEFSKQFVNNWKFFQQFFKTNFPNAYEKIPQLEEQFKNNPISPLSTLYTENWHFKDKMLLMGDAAHAIVPFYGQGMNCCFEDCRIFYELLKDKDFFTLDWESLFNHFFELRKKNTDAIAQMAIENYLEMRKFSKEEQFIFLKEVEHELSNLYPNKFASGYHLVTFSPYSEYSKIQHITKIQRRIIQEYCTHSNYQEFLKTSSHPREKMQQLMDKIGINGIV